MAKTRELISEQHTLAASMLTGVVHGGVTGDLAGTHDGMAHRGKRDKEQSEECAGGSHYCGFGGIMAARTCSLYRAR